VFIGQDLTIAKRVPRSSREGRPLPPRPRRQGRHRRPDEAGRARLRGTPPALIAPAASAAERAARVRE